jgi:hypothetical protein
LRIIDQPYKNYMTLPIYKVLQTLYNIVEPYRNYQTCEIYLPCGHKKGLSSFVQY